MPFCIVLSPIELRNNNVSHNYVKLVALSVEF